MSFCGANVDSGTNAEASEASGAGISVLGNLRISIWINGTAIIKPIAGLNGYEKSSSRIVYLLAKISNECGAIRVYGSLKVFWKILGMFVRNVRNRSLYKHRGKG